MPRHGGGAALTALRVLLAERDITRLKGCRRGRPDPVLEEALRAAFAEFDRELAAVMLAADWHMPTGDQIPVTRRKTLWAERIPVTPQDPGDSPALTP